MANFLFVDTSSTVATIATGNGTEILACERFSNQVQQAAVINLMIESVLQKSGWDVKSIDAFCVCAGPGSYTGLRVGMSTVKGMAFALGKPMICFDKMQLLAQSLLIQNVNHKDIGVLLIARKGEFFWATFNPEGNPILAPKHIYENDLEKEVQPQYWLLTDVPDLSFQNEMISIPNEYSPDVAEWMNLAIQKWVQKDFADIAYAEPFYLKAAFTTTPKNKI